MAAHRKLKTKNKRISLRKSERFANDVKWDIESELCQPMLRWTFGTDRSTRAFGTAGGWRTEEGRQKMEDGWPTRREYRIRHWRTFGIDQGILSDEGL